MNLQLILTRNKYFFIKTNSLIKTNSFISLVAFCTLSKLINISFIYFCPKSQCYQLKLYHELIFKKIINFEISVICNAQESDQCHRYNIKRQANTESWTYGRWDQVPRKGSHPMLTGHNRRQTMQRRFLKEFFIRNFFESLYQYYITPRCVIVSKNNFLICFILTYKCFKICSFLDWNLKCLFHQ